MCNRSFTAEHRAIFHWQVRLSPSGNWTSIQIQKVMRTAGNHNNCQSTVSKELWSKASQPRTCKMLHSSLQSSCCMKWTIMRIQWTIIIHNQSSLQSYCMFFKKYVDTHDFCRYPPTVANWPGDHSQSAWNTPLLLRRSARRWPAGSRWRFQWVGVIEQMGGFQEAIFSHVWLHEVGLVWWLSACFCLGWFFGCQLMPTHNLWMVGAADVYFELLAISSTWSAGVSLRVVEILRGRKLWNLPMSHEKYPHPIPICWLNILFLYFYDESMSCENPQNEPVGICWYSPPLFLAHQQKVYISHGPNFCGAMGNLWEPRGLLLELLDIPDVQGDVTMC